MRKERLPTPIEPLVDQRAPKNAQQMWRNVEALRRRRAQRRRAPRWQMLVASFVLLIGTGLAARSWLQLGEPSSGPLLSAEHSVLPASITPGTGHAALDLSDGSRITVAGGSRLDVLESSGRHVALALRTGRVRFDVRPRGPRTWRVDCGVLSVEVVGTAFVIQRKLGKVRVEVLRGAVLVRGAGVPDGVARLDKGQSFESVEASSAAGGESASGADLARLRSRTDSPSSAPPEPGSAVSEPLGLPEGAGPAQPPFVVSPLVRLRERLEQQPSRSAQAPAAPSETPPEKPPETKVDALFREADSARRHGQVGKACFYLQSIVREHADDPRAALAAFALARLELGQLSAPARAADSLRLALALGLPGALHEDAYAKLVLAHEKAGQLAEACAARAEYTRRFPGRHKLHEPTQRCSTDARD